MIYWFTGQPGHGKTTLAKAMLAHLASEGVEAFHVDGDDLRSLTTNEDYSREGREDNIRRAQTIAHYLQAKGHTGEVTLISPYRDLPASFRAEADVTEVYVHTTETRGREGKHASDYEAPTSNFIDVDTTGKSEKESLAEVLDAVSQRS